MIASPAAIWEASAWMVDPVTSPAGNITHAARGWDSLSTRSATELAPVAPSYSSALTASGSRSKTTQV